MESRLTDQDVWNIIKHVFYYDNKCGEWFFKSHQAQQACLALDKLEQLKQEASNA